MLVLMLALVALMLSAWLASFYKATTPAPAFDAPLGQITLAQSQLSTAPSKAAPLTLGQLQRWLFEADNRDPQTILAFIETKTSHLTHEEQHKVLALAQRYIAYKAALFELADGKYEAQFTAESLQRQLQQRHQLQHQFFTDEQVESLFGEQHQQDYAAIERLQLRQDSQLSDAERWRLVEAQIQQQPVATQQAFEPSIQIRNLSHQLNRGETISRDQLVAEFGEQTGERLAQTLDSQQRWQVQLSDAKQQLEAISGITNSADRQQAIDELINTFEPHQRRRAQALLGLLDGSVQ